MPAKNNSITEPGELPRYSALADRLESDLAKLGDLHKQRDELTGQANALGLTRNRLHQSFLDAEAPSATLAESLGELETERLVLAGSLEALAPRIQTLEEALHATLPLALQTFGRLREYVVSQVLESCRHQVRSLVEPGLSVADEHVDALAISLPAFVGISRITLPALSFSWSRELDPVPMHWSSLVRPLSEAERVAQRRETIDCLISAAKALCEAARRLLEAASGYAEGVPTFKCEAEPVVPAVVDPKFLEWQTPLGGSDREFFEAVCREGGRDPNALNEQEQAIMARMMAERRRPYEKQSLGSPELLGSTTLAEDQR